jgi:hypothetical protein
MTRNFSGDPPVKTEMGESPLSTGDPTENLGEMWAKLRNAKFISKLDLRHGFWQMGLHPKSRHKKKFSRRTYSL